MKKIALLLGSLALAATSFAGGKEIVPVEVEVIEIVREVPVYRNITNGGYLEMFYKWWGNSNEHTRDGWYWGEDANGNPYQKVKTRQKNGNRGRLQIQGSVNLTENQNIYFRVRDNNAVSTNGVKTYYESPTTNDLLSRDNYRSGGGTQVRVRYSFAHDFANLNATSRLHYDNSGEYTGAAIGKHNLEYQFRMQFAEYMLDNDFVRTTNFVLAPKVGYSWDNSGVKSDYYNGIRRDALGNPIIDPWTGEAERLEGSGPASTPYFGLALETNHALPLNFSLEANFHLTSVHSNNRYYGERKSNLQAYAEVYLRNTTPIIQGDRATLSFVFEGGLDPYRYSQRKIYQRDLSDYYGVGSNGYANLDGKPKSTTSTISGEDDPVSNDKISYSAFALPALRLDYQATNNVNLFAVAGAEYRNIHESKSEAQGWVWQPTAWAGFRVNF